MDLTQSINKQTDVGLKITRHLLGTEGKDKNMVYSPLSIHIVLSLIAAGSKGPTKAQLLSFLESNSSDSLNALASYLLILIFYGHESSISSPRLSFANGLWVDKSTPIKPSFKEIVDFAYKAAVNQADFKNNADGVRREVNAWAEKETNGLIKEILPPNSVDDETRIIFANALSFKGVWKDQFWSQLTNDYDFHLLSGSSVKVPFMQGTSVHLVSAYDGFKVLKLPYKTGLDRSRSFSMYLFLPDAKDGLPALVEKICSESGFLDRHVPNEHVSVRNFRIPKFKFSSRFEASDILKDLGLELPFIFDDKGGKVTEMVHSPPGEDPYVSSILHKSFIDVNEQGTEAVAVTGLSLRGGGCCPFLDHFVADHPFLFLIREEVTRAVLFIGHVLNPLQG